MLARTVSITLVSEQVRPKSIQFSTKHFGISTKYLAKRQHIPVAARVFHSGEAACVCAPSQPERIWQYLGYTVPDSTVAGDILMRVLLVMMEDRSYPETQAGKLETEIFLQVSC